MGKSPSWKLLRTWWSSFCKNFIMSSLIFWELSMCKVGLCKMLFLRIWIRDKNLTCVLARFWLWCRWFLEKCCIYKLFHFESSLISYKVQLIWICVARVIAWLVVSTRSWTDYVYVVFSRGNCKNMKIWSKWNL